MVANSAILCAVLAAVLSLSGGVFLQTLHAADLPTVPYGSKKKASGVIDFPSFLVSP